MAGPAQRALYGLLCAIVSGQLALASPRGQQIYREGLADSGPACIHCHRASGLGSVEGSTVIPPITGDALFRDRSTTVVRQDQRFNPGLSAPHAPYTRAQFASAVRDGVHLSGRPLQAPMPRYPFSDADIDALADYLETLSQTPAPGTGNGRGPIQVATVLTPDVPPTRARALIQTLQTVLGQVSVNIHSGLRQKTAAIERQQRSRRPFVLQVWQLHGKPGDWPAQLQAHQQENPVFALISGTGEADWAPVQSFCETAQVVCWLPSTDAVPANADASNYSFYYQAGARNEVAVIAQQLARADAPNGQVVQIVGRRPLERRAAALLSARIGQATLLHWPPLATERATWKQTVAHADTLLLWLDASALRTLPRDIHSQAQVYWDGLEGGDPVSALPPGLRRHARWVTPFELPAVRALNLERFKGWAAGSGVPVRDERLQSEAYFAARSFVFLSRRLLNNWYTDYFVEQAEAGLSMFESMQVQDEVQSSMMAPAMKRAVAEDARSPTIRTLPPADLAPAERRPTDRLEGLRKRASTSIYPHLSLGPRQRFASKGAYVIPLGANGAPLLHEAQWQAP